MLQYEHDYAALITDILANGADKQTRNGKTKSLFGMSLEVKGLEHYFPILQGRKMYYKGVFGELAAMLRRPTCVQDFKEWGCNYWDLWANEDGSLKIDYGNTWFDYEGFNQIAQLKENLRNNPNDRRMIINGWRAHKLQELSLPCCHYSYQFYVANGELSMVWTQRSVDVMIGLPSDIIFAAAWLIMVANEFGFVPGKVKFDFGDCHIYEEHIQGAYEYIHRVETDKPLRAPIYKLRAPKGKDFCAFEPKDIEIPLFDSLQPLSFKLKA